MTFNFKYAILFRNSDEVLINAKERVSDNVYWFQSDVYAQVTAGAIIGPQWAVLIDTLMPEETPEIKHFIENELLVPVRYVINTHHHADHSWGNCVFFRTPRSSVMNFVGN